MPNDPDSYDASRELVPSDMVADLERARIVITNYRAFKLRARDHLPITCVEPGSELLEDMRA